MNPELEQTFEKIADAAISKAEEVECSLMEFADGLNLIVSLIHSRAELADNEAGESDDAE